jgi:TRAP-type C4-dicarboxylate transport system permease large subunit
MNVKNFWGSRRSGGTFFGAFWALLMPLIILGGILGGIFTPTEAAVVAAVYGAIIGFGVYRELKISDLPKILRQSSGIHLHGDAAHRNRQYLWMDPHRGAGAPECGWPTWSA